MSRRSTSKAQPRPDSLGAWLRQLRKARKLPLRTVAAAAEIDTTLMSKIELGQRLPTEAQTHALARFFGLPVDEVAAKRIAERFWIDHHRDPAAHRAALLIQETARHKEPGRHARQNSRHQRRCS